jgi:hypothetical protein
MPQIRRIIPIIFLILAFYAGHSTVLPKGGKDSATAKKDTAHAPDPFVLRPVLGIGTGLFSYFGNLDAIYGRVQNPMTSRIAYELTYAQRLTPVIELNLDALFGQVAVNRRTPALNWNFQSEIRGGGIHLLFKILPKQSLSPYILTGIESFEYLSKIDLYDQHGNKYYYWNDGTIRNVAQNSPLAASSTIVYRDYSYESDIRAMNINNAGKYSLQTYAVPLGVGFMFKVGKRTDFLIGSTLHYTFTNHIDGYGDSIKSKKNDMFIMSSITLRFDISRKRKNADTSKGGYLPESLEGVDFVALMNDDYDHDGVRDWDDSCAGTPKGVKVDAKGCPLDSDHDGVPDYLDKEENTGKGSLTDGRGVALTDSAIRMQYLMFMDTTGEFAQIEVQNTIASAPGSVGKNVNYTIQLGRFTKGIPPDIMDKLLSIPDVKSTTMPDSSSVYTVGSYNDFSVAQMRQQQLLHDGIPDAKVVYRKGKDFIEAKEAVPGTTPNNNVPVTGNNLPKNNVPVTGNNNPPNNNVPVTGNNSPPNNNIPINNPPSTSGVMVYRIQLGAYSHKLSRDVFMNVDDIVEVKTENGFYTYSAGSFTNYQDAVNYKTQLMVEGFPDTFIKAYKDGKRIPLKNAGATFIQPTKEDMSEQVTHETNTLDKSQISFKVQVGVFRGAPPQDLANRFKTLADLSTDRDSTGMTHYLVGSYTDFDSAKNMRDKLAAEPLFKNAFVVAYFKDGPIPLSQALSILKQ